MRVISDLCNEPEAYIRTREHAQYLYTLDNVGSSAGIVEVNETYTGSKSGLKTHSSGFRRKDNVFASVDRCREVRSTHITGKNFACAKYSLCKHLDVCANLMID